jgi:chloramphenicol O-acetyltransferase type A
MENTKRAPSLRAIDMSTYDRLSVYRYFIHYDVPVYSRTVHIDISKCIKYIKKNNISFSLSMTVLVARAANEVMEFRHRIQRNAIVEYDFIVPLYTHKWGDRPVTFVQGTYSGQFGEDYEENLAIRNGVVKGQRQIIDFMDQGHVVVSINPWFSFTALTFPYYRHTASVPVVAIGKYYEQTGQILLPVAIQNHHALMDGYHVSQFVNNLTAYLAEPEKHMALSSS